MPPNRRIEAEGEPTTLHLVAPVDIECAPGDDPQTLPTFSMVAYTGGPMRLLGFVDPVVVDLDGIKLGEGKSRPVLKDHSRSMVVGHTTQTAVVGNQLLISGVISGTSQVAREVVASARNEFPWQASIGADPERIEMIRPGATVTVNGREIEGPVALVRESTLREVSFVAIGADDETSAKVAARHAGHDGDRDDGSNDMMFERWLKDNGFGDAQSLSASQRSTLEAAWRAETEGQDRPPLPGNFADYQEWAVEAGWQPDKLTPRATCALMAAWAFDVEAASGDGGGSVDSGAGDPTPAERYRMEAAAEVERIAAIRNVCNGGHAQIEAQAIREGWNRDRAELAVLRASRPTGPYAAPSNGQAPEARTIEAALCLTAGMPEDRVGEYLGEKAVDEATSQRLRGYGIHALMFEVIQAAGLYARAGRVDNETIRCAFEADRMLRASGSGFSTISLSGILGNVANKALLESYVAVRTVVSQIAAETDTNDFKTFTRYRLTGKGIFEVVGPDGELKHMQLEEQSFSNRVRTRGRIVTLTREDQINDDLGAFLQIPTILGRGAALARERAVFELLLSNPGSPAFFSTDNKNLVDSSGALSISALTLAEQLFMDQVDSDGNPILAAPRVLLVPTGLKADAEVLMAEKTVNETTTNNKPKPNANPHVGKFQVASSPYMNAQGLTGQSGTAWYLFADPRDLASIEVAYLRGQRTPVIESGETDFDTLGMKWRGYFDFGVGLQDHRAAVKSNGT